MLNKSLSGDIDGSTELLHEPWFPCYNEYIQGLLEDNVPPLISSQTYLQRGWLEREDTVFYLNKIKSKHRM